MSDEFFHKKNCDRCGNLLKARIMSWFTEEALCMDCSQKENEIKQKLRDAGRPDHEGCGFIPKV